MGRTLIVTSPLEHGPDVTSFQRELTHAGYFHGPVDGVYGNLTAQAVYRAKYWLGYPKPDHAAGDTLYAYLTGKKKPNLAMRLLTTKRKAAVPKEPLRVKALHRALKDNGYKENPPNTNNNRYGIWYGFNRVAWCNMAVTFWYVTVGSKAFARGHRYAYVPYMDADARAGRNGLSIAHPVMAGDVVTYTWPGEPGGPHHTGLFIRWIDKAAGRFEAFEGNTAVGNNSNGGQVMHRTDRHLNEVRTFIRVSK